MRNKLVRLVAAAMLLTLVGTACKTSTKDDDKMKKPKATVTSDTPAAALRARLNNLLSEHVYFAALASGAALRGDTKAFEGLADALNGTGASNSTDIINAIGEAYDEDTKNTFGPLWRKHIGFVVSYVQGVGGNDSGKKDQAVKDLTAYAAEFGGVIESVTGLPKDAVQSLVMEHILTLKSVIDAQGAKDNVKVYANLRMAYGHMNKIGDALASATVKKTGDFEGDPDSKAAALRSTINMALREHVLLAASATGAALRGDTAAFTAIADSLNGNGPSNSTDIINTIGAGYGDDTKKAFDPLWRKHIGFVVEYTQALGKGDKPGSDAAVKKLTDYAAEFAGVIESVSGLPKATVQQLTLDHILSLKAVIDAQAAKQPTATLLRSAVAHMQMIADPLAQATVEKFPDKFA